jgi:thiol-disulfide isomerase/thioredoxin
MNRKKLFTTAAVFVIISSLSILLSCAKIPPEPDQRGSPEALTAVAESYVPGLDVFDYFKDAYDLTSNSTGKYFYKYTYKKVGLDEQPSTIATGPNTPVDYTTHPHGTWASSHNPHDGVIYYAHPFRTLSYHEFYRLLTNNDRANPAKGIEDGSGYYFIFFGGEWEPGTKAAITVLNDVLAERYITYEVSGNATAESAAPNIDHHLTSYFSGGSPVYVYNFDFRLSGGELGTLYDSDIRTDAATFFFADAGGTVDTITENSTVSVTNLYDVLYKSFTTLDEEITRVDTAASRQSRTVTTVKIPHSTKVPVEEKTDKFIPSPSLLLFRKTTGGSAAVNEVIGLVDASTVDFNNSAQTAAFKTEVERLIDTGNRGSRVQAGDLKKYDYFTDAFRIYNAGGGSYDNFTPRDPSTSIRGNDGNPRNNLLHRFKVVTYKELTRLLQSDGNYVIYFGTSWCPYSNELIRHLDRAREGFNVPEIYVFDATLDGAAFDAAHHGLNIRNVEQLPASFTDGILTGNASTAPYTRLYANMLKFFGDFRAYSWLYNDIKIGEDSYTKIGIPAVFLYNKNNVDAYGRTKPILAFHENVYVFSYLLTNDTNPQAIALDTILSSLLGDYNLGKLTCRLKDQS